MLTWNKLLVSITERMREPEIMTGIVSAEIDVPYSELDTVERMLYRASLMMLREIDVNELEAIGSLGLVIQTGIGPSSAVPPDAYAVASVAVQPAFTDPFVMTDSCHPKVWFEQMTVDPVIGAFYSFVDRTIVFRGNAANVTYRREPTLEEFRSDAAIFPPGYDEDRIDLTRKMLFITDFLPQARL